MGNGIASGWLTGVDMAIGRVSSACCAADAIATAVAPWVSGMGCGTAEEMGMGADIWGLRRSLSCSMGE
jgi:hypothetical protein